MLLLGLMVAVISAPVHAQEGVAVTIGYPQNTPSLGINTPSWIGQFPITIKSGGSSSQYEAYCLDYEGKVDMGTTYQANIVAAPDTKTWEEVAYILSWHTATTSDEAATVQDAIWRVLNNYNGELSIPTNIDSNAASWVTDAADKEVVHPGDQLTWISPSSSTAIITSANQGQTIIFQVQLANSTGGRPNVQIDFSAKLQYGTTSQTLSSTYINPTQTFTDNNGHAKVSVTVPSSAPYGSTIIVQASTQSIWPQKYLDLAYYNPTLQNIIVLSSTLTASTNLSILGSITVNAHLLGSIMVTPESAFGALGAIVAAAAANIVYRTRKRPTKRTNYNQTNEPLHSVRSPNLVDTKYENKNK